MTMSYNLRFVDSKLQTSKYFDKNLVISLNTKEINLKKDKNVYIISQN